MELSNYKSKRNPNIISKAFYIASSGRPGPVLIDITKDAQFEFCDYNYKKCNGIRSYLPVPELQNEQIAEAAKVINSSKKPQLFGVKE